MRNQPSPLRTILLLTALCLPLSALTACGGGGGGGGGNLFASEDGFDLDDVIYAAFDGPGFGEVAMLDAFDLDDHNLAPPNGTGDGPADMAIHRDLGLLYVANRNEDSVTVYDLATLDFVFEILTGPGSEPVALAVNEDQDWLYVVLQGDDTVAMYDAEDGAFWREEDTAPFPTDVVWYDFGNAIFVSNAGNDTVTAYEDGDLDAYSFVNLDADGGVDPRSLSLDGARRELYIACRDTDNVLIYDLDTLDFIDALAVGDRPEFVLAVGVMNRLFVSNAGDDTVSGFHLSTLLPLANSPVDTGGDNPGAMAVHEKSGLLYVANRNSNTIAILDADDLDEFGPSPYFVGGALSAIVAMDE